MKQVIRCCAVALALVTAGCGSSTGSATEPGGPNVQEQGASIELDPKWRGTMDVSPSEAAPGQTVALTFPPGHQDVRGVAFSLSEWTAEEWKVTHYLTSGTHPSTEPSWWSVEDAEGRGWNDVGVSGAGPDRVVVPDTATEGTHLLCTANARDEKCTLIEVRTD